MHMTTHAGAHGPVDPAAAADALRARLPWTPDVLLVLGSGLAGLADRIDDPITIPFSEVPGFPEPGVEGHVGRFVAGIVSGRRVLAQQGRFHVYEGHPMDVVALPVRTAAMLGIGTLIVTNAAGGIRRDLTPGTLVLIEDHLNLQMRSPLIGPAHPGETRFPDMTVAYDAALRASATACAAALGITLPSGVYAALTGPSYETPAEIRMLERIGADVVGMSTVPEVIAARARGMRCLGISLVTNPAAGILPTPLDHSEVMEVGRRAGLELERLVREVLARWPEHRAGAGPTDGDAAGATGTA